VAAGVEAAGVVEEELAVGVCWMASCACEAAVLDDALPTGWEGEGLLDAPWETLACAWPGPEPSSCAVDPLPFAASPDCPAPSSPSPCQL
jgi:hypothetical protein